MPKDDKAKIETNRKVASVTEAIGKIIGDRQVEDRGKAAGEATGRSKPTGRTRD